ncbi:MAG: sterol desaturase family protein [Spirochaetes bacterium]|nr:sterol desaturase family protein [Spirochaetota bacterium]
MDKFNPYAFVTPIAIALLLVEIIYNLTAKKGYYSFSEAVANIGTAIGNQTSNLLVAVLIFWGYGYIYENIAPYKIPTNWWSGAILLVLIDFLFYWCHRFGHRVNLFWAAHSPHHSAEEFNFGVALRASVTMRLYSFLFFLPLPFMGFEPVFIYGMVGIHLFMSFWHHTRVIGKMPYFEIIFNSPSHHRVHHGTNAQYLDKNYSEFLIIWDKFFGTFEPEGEEVCFGVLDHPKSYNPVTINFHHFKVVAKLSWQAPYFWDKIKVWFMPPEWMPRGLDTSPKKKLGMTIAEQVRYAAVSFPASVPYLALHVALGLGYMLLVISPKSPLAGWERAAGSGLIWLMIISWGGILESRRWAPYLEAIRVIGMSGSIVYMLQKYGKSMPLAEYALGAFTILCLGYVFWFFRPGSGAAKKAFGT